VLSKRKTTFSQVNVVFFECAFSPLIDICFVASGGHRTAFCSLLKMHFKL